jgi:hypothetical protein
MSENLYKIIYAFGFSSKNSNQKKFLFGQYPIADAFIVWGRSTELSQNPLSKPINNNWRINFHIISLLIIIFLWFLLFSKNIFSKIKKTTWVMVHNNKKK